MLVAPRQELARIPRARRLVGTSGDWGIFAVPDRLADRGMLTDAVEEVGGKSEKAWLIDD
jgi:hypothetical protein